MDGFESLPQTHWKRGAHPVAIGNVAAQVKHTCSYISGMSQAQQNKQQQNTFIYNDKLFFYDYVLPWLIVVTKGQAYSLKAFPIIRNADTEVDVQ